MAMLDVNYKVVHAAVVLRAGNLTQIVCRHSELCGEALWRWLKDYVPCSCRLGPRAGERQSSASKGSEAKWLQGENTDLTATPPELEPQLPAYWLYDFRGIFEILVPEFPHQRKGDFS